MHCSQKILNSIFVHEPSRSCLEANCSGAKCCNQRSKKLVENFKGKHNFGEQNQQRKSDKSRENEAISQICTQREKIILDENKTNLIPAI